MRINNNIIDIQQSVLFEKSGFSIKLEGKTYNARCQIPMCPILREFLLKYKKEHHIKKVKYFPKPRGAAYRIHILTI